MSSTDFRVGVPGRSSASSCGAAAGDGERLCAVCGGERCVALHQPSPHPIRELYRAAAPLFTT